MKTYFIALTAVLTLGCALAQASPMPNNNACSTTVVSWLTPQGQKRLERSRYKVNFFSLANQFESQTNKFLCGPTSAVIVLNAMRAYNPKIRKPIDPSLFPKNAIQYLKRKWIKSGWVPVYQRYTQNNFFTPASESIQTKLEFYGKPIPGYKADYGINLLPLGMMMRTFGVSVAIRKATPDLTDEMIVSELKNAMRTKGTYVIVNLDRKGICEQGSGHFSPLAAYDAASDSFLLMDVTPSKAPWVWIQSSQLIRAMRRYDGLTRGYLVITE